MELKYQRGVTFWPTLYVRKQHRDVLSDHRRIVWPVIVVAVRQVYVGSTGNLRSFPENLVRTSLGHQVRTDRFQLRSCTHATCPL